VFPARMCRCASSRAGRLALLIVVLGLVAAGLVPRFTVSAAEARRNSCAQNVASINAQVERWHAITGAWPRTDLTDMGADASYFPQGIPTCPVDGTAYELDSGTRRVKGHIH